MKRSIFDKSNILLWVIVTLFVAAGVTAGVILRGERIALQLKTDRPLNCLIIFESGGKPASSQLLLFYPTKSKAAMLDIPGNTAIILKTVKRMDRVDYIYKSASPGDFVTEISAYLDVPIQAYMVFDEGRMRSFVDMLEGLQVFIPSMIVQSGAPNSQRQTDAENQPQGASATGSLSSSIRLPGGAVTLDGDKVLQYLRYREEGEGESDALIRRQKLATAFLKKLAEKSALLADKKAGNVLVQNIKSNLGPVAMKRLLTEMAKLDIDTILLQKLTGVYREVDGDQLFFPFYDGQLARDMLKQTLSAMNSQDVLSASGRVYTIEILNGTSERGLAARTSEIFESFGYDVVSVGNAVAQDQEKTVVIDRYGDKEALAATASVIKCDNYAEASTYRGSIKADYTIILGKDFNGRICVK